MPAKQLNNLGRYTSFWVLAVCWPVAMITPYLLRTPLPGSSVSLFRQDLLIAAILVVTCAVLIHRYASGALETIDRFWPLGQLEYQAVCALALFIVWSAVSSSWALDSASSFYYVAKWVGFASFFILIRRAASQTVLLHLSLSSLGALVCLTSLICLGDAWLNPNSQLQQFAGFGEVHAMAVPLFAALAFQLDRRRSALCAATAALAWAGMLQLQQRAALIGASVALIGLVMGILAFRQFRPRNRNRIMVIVASLVLATILQSLPSLLVNEQASPSVFSKMGSTITVNSGTVTPEENVNVRLLLWSVAYEMWRANPWTGVGASNFEAAYPAARQAFAARHPQSSLLNDREDLLAQRAHNEYMQMLAELGMTGLVLFLIFCAFLTRAAWRALRHGNNPLVLGAICSLVAFALGSGASSASFRWFMSGLMFFFTSAIVFRFATQSRGNESSTVSKPRLLPATVVLASLTITSLIFLAFTARQGVVASIREAAKTSPDSAERLFETALWLNEGDTETHFAYGMWHYTQRRYLEAIPHLRYTVRHGFNDAGSYSNLASAEAGAGQFRASVATMATAESIYPRSLYVRVRHAVALMEAQDEAEAGHKFAEAVAMDSRKARGWWYLLTCGQRCASHAARADIKNIALAVELTPSPLVELALLEREVRPPTQYALPRDIFLSHDGPTRTSSINTTRTSSINTNGNSRIDGTHSPNQSLFQTRQPFASSRTALQKRFYF